MTLLSMGVNRKSQVLFYIYMMELEYVLDGLTICRCAKIDGRLANITEWDQTISKRQSNLVPH